jgi:crotonobetainyl-CoA:carnitine CoA-transferase CaiB-like acyl-CoA transferase
MDSHSLNQTLQHATINELAQVIDWMRRPWAYDDNDSLRAAWHRTRRKADHRAKLIELIEQQLGAMTPRDLEQVARTMSVDFTPIPSASDLARAMTTKLAPRKE